MYCMCVIHLTYGFPVRLEYRRTVKSPERAVGGVDPRCKGFFKVLLSPFLFFPPFE